MRSLYRSATPLTLVLLAAACAGDHPTTVEPSDMGPLLNRSAAACTNVRGTADFALDLVRTGQTGQTVFSGPVAGDLQGTIVVVERGPATPPPPNGEGAAHLLSDVTFATDRFGTFSGEEIFVAAPVTPTSFRFNGRLTVTGGDQIESGFLRVHGTFDVSGFPTGGLTYHGRICT